MDTTGRRDHPVDLCTGPDSGLNKVGMPTERRGAGCFGEVCAVCIARSQAKGHGLTTVLGSTALMAAPCGTQIQQAI
jgi:hypothetical protein